MLGTPYQFKLAPNRGSLWWTRTSSRRTSATYHTVPYLHAKFQFQIHRISRAIAWQKMHFL